MTEIDVTKVEVEEYLKYLLNKYYALSKIPDLPSIENTIKKYFDKEYQSLLNLNDNEYSSKRCVSFSLTKYNFERLKVYNDEFGGFISLTEEEVKLLFELTQLHGYIKKNEHLLDLFNKVPIQKRYYDKSLQSLIEKEISKIGLFFKKDSIPSNKIEIDYKLIETQLTKIIALYCDRYEKQFSEKFDNYYGDRIAFCNKKLTDYNNDTIEHLAEIDNGTFIPDLDKSGKIISLAHSIAHIKLIKFINSKLQTELHKDQISDLEKRENEIKQSELRLTKLESDLIQKKKDLVKKELELENRESKLENEITTLDTLRTRLNTDQDNHKKELAVFKKTKDEFPAVMQWQSQTNFFGTFFGELIKGDVIDTSQANAIKFLNSLFKDRDGVPFKKDYAKNALAHKEKSKITGGDYYDLSVMLLTKMLVSIFKSKFSPEYKKSLKSKTDDRKKLYTELTDISDIDRKLLLEQLDKMLKEYKMGSTLPYPDDDKENLLKAIEKIVDKNKLGIVIPSPKHDKIKFYEAVQDIIVENKLERTFTLN